MDNEFVNAKIVEYCKVWGMGWDFFLNCWYFSSWLFLQTFAIFLPDFFLTFRFHLPFELSFLFHHIFQHLHLLILSRHLFVDSKQAFLASLLLHHTLFISFRMAQARCWFLGRFFLTHYIAFKSIEIGFIVGGILVESSILSDLTTFGLNTLT